MGLDGNPVSPGIRLKSPGAPCTNFWGRSVLFHLPPSALGPWGYPGEVWGWSSPLGSPLNRVARIPWDGVGLAQILVLAWGGFGLSLGFHSPWDFPGELRSLRNLELSLWARGSPGTCPSATSLYFLMSSGNRLSRFLRPSLSLFLTISSSCWRKFFLRSSIVFMYVCTNRYPSFFRLVFSFFPCRVLCFPGELFAQILGVVVGVVWGGSGFFCWSGFPGELFAQIPLGAFGVLGEVPRIFCWSGFPGEPLWGVSLRIGVVLGLAWARASVGRRTNPRGFRWFTHFARMV